MNTKFDQDQDDDWSDDISDDAPEQAKLQPRAYQIEMFEHSMRENIIATIETGSGKTMIAKLRIEAELLRSPDKLTWMTTPSVALANQQHMFLKSQLPAYAFKLITGNDNVEYWSSKSIWDKALHNMNGVVSTPQILLDALQHGFVSIALISLLVIDEAHHCVAKSPINTMMQQFYFPRVSAGNTSDVSHVLGLTASPIIRDNVAMLKTLETNLNAVCKSPITQVEEYKSFVHQPVLVRLPYKSDSGVSSILVRYLGDVVSSYNIYQDPTFLKLKVDDSLLGAQKFEKIVQREETPILRQITDLYRHALEMHTALGAWATDHYVRACINALHDMVNRRREEMWTLEQDEHEHMHVALEPVRLAALDTVDEAPEQGRVSHKAAMLIHYLASELRDDMSCIVFVQRRSTAFGLSSLLSAHPELKSRRPFPYVGLVSTQRQSLRDLAEKREQDQAFQEFRAQQRSICVASPAVEEGIDIQSCNLVVRFDEPATFRSFIQSRGRARSPNSKYAILHHEADPLAKYDNWKDIEHEMKELYAQQNRALAQCESVEDRDEESDRTLRIKQTGAVLTLDNARQHLQHFCATLPKGDHGQVRVPVYIMKGRAGQDRSCTVVLPSSVSPLLQTTNSLLNWRTERMAKKDAAFEAHKRLYHAGLINDHLLPPSRPKEIMNTLIEKRDSTYEVNGQFDPWKVMGQTFQKHTTIYAHRISISGAHRAFPPMLLLLPVRVNFVHDCSLHVNANSQYLAKISPIDCLPNLPLQLCQQITEFMFQIVLGRRLSAFRANDKKFPYLLVPELQLRELDNWFSRSQKKTPLNEVHLNGDLTEQRYLLVKHGEQIPYMFKPAFRDSQVLMFQDGETVDASRFTRTIDFFSASSSSETPKPHSLPVEKCSILGLSAGYGEAMLYMPCIMYYVEVALRAQAACHGPLKPINYQDLGPVISALTSPSADVHNYQRLEYMGDTLLKFHTSVNSFCNNPLMPESQLSVMRDITVSNARLQRVARDLGLDSYITNARFSGQKWNPEVTAEEPSSRQLSSKILADIVEALLGAAHEDGNTDEEKESKVLATLNLFLPDIIWHTPSNLIQKYKANHATLPDPLQKLAAVEQMLDYHFSNRTLLAEAMTHSTPLPGVQSYERLEFLGDAVIDLIVKTILYGSSLLLNEAAMHRRQAALLNEHIFAFFSTTITHAVEQYDVQVPRATKQAEFTAQTETKYLNDYVVRVSDVNTTSQRASFLQNFHQVSTQISTALSSGNVYPWCDLFHLDAPKSYSDILESIIGAVYIDSNGSLAACEHVLSHIGYIAVVHRFANNAEIEFQQPLDRLRMLKPEIQVKSRRCGSARRSTVYWQARIETGIAIHTEAGREVEIDKYPPERKLVPSDSRTSEFMNGIDRSGPGHESGGVTAKANEESAARGVKATQLTTPTIDNNPISDQSNNSQNKKKSQKRILGESLAKSSCRVEAENRAALDALEKLGLQYPVLENKKRKREREREKDKDKD